MFDATDDTRRSTEQGAATGAPRGRRERRQAVLEVVRKERITPRMTRVRLGGDGIADLRYNESTDKYVKLLLADPASGLSPPYDTDALRETNPELLPARRTYTVRSWDHEAGTIDLDFVLHGTTGGDHSGIAARWADSALPGDIIAATGAGGGYTPDPETDHHLLIGDHSALPAISASLEAMPATARGTALIQLDHEEDRQPITAPDGIEVRWLIGDLELLPADLEQLQLPDPERVQVFAHGERGIVKRLRRELVTHRQIPRAAISISAYWAQGRIEDQFQAEKREPIGRIDD